MQAIRKTPSLPNYLNENQVAERLGVSVKLLRKHRWESKGLPYVKFGTRVLYVCHRLNPFLPRHHNLLCRFRFVGFHGTTSEMFAVNVK